MRKPEPKFQKPANTIDFDSLRNSGAEMEIIADWLEASNKISQLRSALLKEMREKGISLEAVQKIRDETNAIDAKLEIAKANNDAAGVKAILKSLS